MEDLSKLLLKVWEVLKAYDIHKVVNLIHSIKWPDLLKSPVALAVCILVFLVIVISKRYKYLIFFLSIVAMIFLIDKTLTTNLEDISFKNFFGFFFGAIFIVSLNIYIFFMRD